MYQEEEVSGGRCKKRMILDKEDVSEEYVRGGMCIRKMYEE